MIYKTLITGAKGFTANSLINNYLKNSEIYLTDITKDSSTKNYFKCDLTKLKDVIKLINKVKPDFIYHLAGTFSNNYKLDYKSNVTSTKNIFDAVLNIKKNTRILLIGSAAEYGNSKDYSIPLVEDSNLNPVSIYGLTKVFQTNLMKFYNSYYNLDIVMARTFNLYGEGISKNLFIGKVYDQIYQYKNKKIKSIILGNLEAKRDYLYIDNAVNYYKIIMKNGISGNVYNVGSGKSILIKEILKVILSDFKLNMNIVKTLDYKSSSINNSVADITKILKLCNNK